MKFSILSSGSTGNATIVQNDKVNLLIDCGLSARRIEQLLQTIGITGQQIDAILITHEHEDHIKGLGTFARRYQLPIYANAKTWEQLHKKIGEIPKENQFFIPSNQTQYFENIKVETFHVSHDAAEPIGYCFYENEKKLSLITDLGYISAHVKEKVKDSDGIILETNHDVNLVRIGKYPWHVKQRIIGDKGHLSNETAAIGLGEILSSKTNFVYMAHLSQNHNHLDLARETIYQVLEQYGVSLKERNVRLMDTYYNQPTAWEHI